MKQKFTREEFIAKWRELRGFAPMYYKGEIVQTDGTDLNFAFGVEVDRWYRKLLTEGDENLLCKEDITRNVSTSVGDGCLMVTLPSDVVRVTDVRLSGWRCRAEVTSDPDSNLALRQLHPYTRSCSDRPVAVLFPDHTLALYPADGSEKFTELKCVMLREDEFALDTAALELNNISNTQ